MQAKMQPYEYIKDISLLYFLFAVAICELSVKIFQIDLSPKKIWEIKKTKIINEKIFIEFETNFFLIR